MTHNCHVECNLLRRVGNSVTKDYEVYEEEKLEGGLRAPWSKRLGREGGGKDCEGSGGGLRVRVS